MYSKNQETRDSTVYSQTDDSNSVDYLDGVRQNGARQSSTSFRVVILIRTSPVETNAALVECEKGAMAVDSSTSSPMQWRREKEEDGRRHRVRRRRQKMEMEKRQIKMKLIVAANVANR